MKYLTLATAIFGLLFVSQSYAQSGAVIPQAGAGHAQKASCVILKRMGPADQVTSHLYSFGIRGKQFQYIEGKLPEGFPFHGRLTDHDVRNLQARGAEVIVLESHYTADELKQARADCQGETGKTPNQADPKAAPAQTPAAEAGTATLAPKPDAANAPATDTAKAAMIEVSSTPAGADIELDGNFVGSTPSTIGASPGDHVILIRKNGFKPWERKLKISTGKVGITTDLEAEAAQSSAVAATETKKEPDLPKQGSQTAAPAGRADATAAGSGPIPRGAAQNTSTLIVTSEPTGAEIYVDNSPAGIAPVTLKLKPGKHSIRGFIGGYQNWFQIVGVDAGQNLSLTVAMQKSK